MAKAWYRIISKKPIVH